MSIHGIGVDLAHIPRFARLLSHPALSARLQRRMLHPLEIEQVSRIRQTAVVHAERRAAEYVASRWAVKEAVTKAFGARLLFPEISVHSPNRAAATLASRSSTAQPHSAASEPHPLPSPPRAADTAAHADPRPSLRFDGQCAALMAAAGVSASSSLLSLSHDGDYAVAFVTLITQPATR